MILASILSDKGRTVVTIDAKASLLVASRILDEHRIGAAVAVSADGRLAGVLSERDIVRRVAELGSAALDLTVDQAMTRDVVTGTPFMTVDEGLECMTDRRIRHLPVLENGELVGIISIGDLVKRKIAVTEAEAAAMKQYIHAG
jgi:CBS domain-containing protein